MSDKPAIVHIGENSPEHVAMRLLAAVAAAENKTIQGLSIGDKAADRQYILDTYSECLTAAKGYR